jgi:hypothetical protein
MKIFNFKKFLERSEYHSIDDSGYNITIVKRDDGHEYKYCDGILYQLSGNDIIVSIEDVELTEGNTFYDDQIKRYIKYFQNGGIVETFPVQETTIGECDNLADMIEYLDDNENFDFMWNLLKEHRKFMDILPKLSFEPEKYGIDSSTLEDIHDLTSLDYFYNKDYQENMDDEDLHFDENLYNHFKIILKYWEDNKNYALTDFNHRFMALKELGKNYVMVDPS